MIAEIAGLEPHRPGERFLIRPTKVFARMNWMATWYECRYKTPQEIETVLEELPVDLIILRREPAPNTPLHEVLLRQAILELFPAKWRKVYPNSPHDVDYDLFERVPSPVVSAADLTKSLHEVFGSHLLSAQ